MNIEIAGVVVRNKDERYLLVQELKKEVYGLWNLPAGHVDDGETPAEAALREGKEETGYDIRLVVDSPILVDKNDEPNHTFYAFLGEVKEGQLLIPKDEILNAGWFSFTEVGQKYKASELRAHWVFRAIQAVEKGEVSYG